MNIAVNSKSSMVASERSQLIKHEKTIERGMVTFVAVGKALAKIRDKRLYRDTHMSFEAYCQERWGKSRQWASMTIQSAGVAEEVSKTVDRNLPDPNSAQARELAKVPKDQQSKVWQAANQDGKPTAKKVRQAATDCDPVVVKKDAAATSAKPTPGSSIVGPEQRKACHTHLGGLVRALQAVAIYEEFVDSLSQIAERLKQI